MAVVETQSTILITKGPRQVSEILKAGAALAERIELFGRRPPIVSISLHLQSRDKTEREIPPIRIGVGEEDDDPFEEALTLMRVLKSALYGANSGDTLVIEFL